MSMSHRQRWQMVLLVLVLLGWVGYSWRQRQIQIDTSVDFARKSSPEMVLQVYWSASTAGDERTVWNLVTKAPASIFVKPDRDQTEASSNWRGEVLGEAVPERQHKMTTPNEILEQFFTGEPFEYVKSDDHYEASVLRNSRLLFINQRKLEEFIVEIQAADAGKARIKIVGKDLEKAPPPQIFHFINTESGWRIYFVDYI